ncbi:MAG: class I adenylate-forming enzyme family protein [Candidatus Helarchaeota archaeon]
MLVNEFLENSADKFPDKIGIINQDKRLSFLEIESLANRLSNALMEEGLSKQERAAIFLENSIESVLSIFAILKAGGVFVVINPQVKAKKIEYILNDCSIKILITDSIRLKEISGILINCPSLQSIIVTDHELIEKRGYKTHNKKLISFSWILKNFPKDRPSKKCIDIDLASLIYTSGTTGIPKGVMLTHLNMVSAADSIIEYLENTPNDIIINVLPLSFDYGLYQVLMSFKFGGTIVLERSFIYPNKMIELITREKVTGLPLVPTIVAILLRLKNLDKYDFSSVRYITNTAQTLPPEFIPKLQKIFPKAKIYLMYGLTECKRVSYLPPEEIERRPASVGKAMPNVEAYLVDKIGNKITKPGEIGELVVRGSNVMKGYWNLPEETEKVLKPGPLPDEKVLYTGDLFKMGNEGFLYFVSRKDDLIKTAGERVSPREIENVLYKMEEIEEAAVIGVDDEILGQAVKAFVTLKDQSKIKEKDVISFCSKHLENFMIPKYVEIRKFLPKTSHGKMSKRDLIQKK